MPRIHRSPRQGALPLALAIGLGLGASHAVLAQSTSGTIYGDIAAGRGDSILIQSSTGISRVVRPNAHGHYTASQLPIGSYVVTLQSADHAVETRDHVSVNVGSGTDVSFAAPTAQTLSGIDVRGNAIPPIDISNVDSRTVITSKELARLPLGHSAEAIALLAPGVTNNTGNYRGATGQSLVSFGGSSASENAYYLNGFNTTDPLRGFGGLSLPYGAIDQEEVYTGGYGAMYGRSDGGVINVVGKSGSNVWHAGAQWLWEPEFARADQHNRYYANGLPSSPVAGDLYSPDSKDRSWSSTASAYFGGPLIKDKLFLFAAAEFQRQEGLTVNPVSSATPAQGYTYKAPRWYTKLNWNITDNNLLELTGASDKYLTSGTTYQYDYGTLTRDGVIGAADNTKNGGNLWTAKYTGYLTDNLTLGAQYGELDTHAYDAPAGYDPGYTQVTGLTNANPALLGNARNLQPVGSLTSPSRGNHTSSLRVDISYRLGDHTLSAGIDNQNAKAIDQGSSSSGPGYSWSYGLSNPNVPISTGLGVPATIGFPNGAQGYWVSKDVGNSLATVRSAQRAQFIEDKWQVSDRWLLSLGLRNDQFENYNAAGKAFITQHKPQWAPRLGASWDVYGDSTFKVYANAGRYYLGLPLNPALNAAGAYVSTSQYFTYSGIHSDGTPSGLTQISGPVSANNAYGVLPDPSTVSAQQMKAEYQDEFILGFTKTAGIAWVYGAKLTQRILRNVIDDYCDSDTVFNQAAALGHDVTLASNPVSCWLINPGRANTFTLIDTAGQHVSVPLSNSELGMPPLKRRYYALETFLEHPFDGRWYGKIDYIFSRSYGDTEGQLRSDLYSSARNSGQTAASTSEDWDNAWIMVNTNGLQNNNHTHQLKLFGYYAITPEWLVSANLSLISGQPKPCLGYYGADHEDPAGYGNSYHFCWGQPSPPGSQGNLPWYRQLDLGVIYRPQFAANRLGIALNVFNVTNNRALLGIYPYRESTPYVENPLYGTPVALQTPRYVRFSVTYDY